VQLRRFGRAPQPQQIAQVVASVSGCAPLIEYRHDFRDRIARNPSGSKRRRQVVEDRPETDCQFRVVLFQPIEVWREQFDGHELVPYGEAVRGAHGFAYRPELSEVVEEVTELGKMRRVRIGWQYEPSCVLDQVQRLQWWHVYASLD